MKLGNLKIDVEFQRVREMGLPLSIQCRTDHSSPGPSVGWTVTPRNLADSHIYFDHEG